MSSNEQESRTIKHLGRWQVCTGGALNGPREPSGGVAGAACYRHVCDPEHHEERQHAQNDKQKDSSPAVWPQPGGTRVIGGHQSFLSAKQRLAHSLK
jgi:hypothetical protein